MRFLDSAGMIFARSSGVECGSTLMRDVFEFLSDESGATAIEYALIAAFISISIAAVAEQIGINLQAPFETARDNLN